jgi:alcohol dehydrogenase class IV
MRLLLPIIGEDQKLVLSALGGSPDGLSADEAGEHAAVAMAKLVATLPLPQRLGDVGVQEADVAELVDHASHDPILMSSGGITRAKIDTLFRSVL